MLQNTAVRELLNRTGMDAKMEALAKLEALTEQAEADLVREKAKGPLRRAVKAWKRGNYPRTAQLALEAVDLDQNYAYAYHLLGMALERMGYLHKALVTYERAFELEPDNADFMLDLGMTAWGMQMREVAEKLFRRYIAMRPESPLGYNNLASILADSNQSTIAVEVLRDAIHRMPSEPILWNTLATLLAEDGRVQESFVFYEEALRLDPAYFRCFHNLGYAYLHLGMMEKTLDAAERALERLPDPRERLEARYMRSVSLMGMGRLEEGFEEYEVRIDPLFHAHVPHMLKAPLWQGEPLEGKRLLVCGEQGLGDEIMLANAVPDLARAVGPAGKLQIAVNYRLVPLFKRSFPDAEVGVFEDKTHVNPDGQITVRYVPFATKEGEPDYYIRMGSTLRLLRKHIEDFPDQALLKPDRERVAAYRAQLRAKDDRPTIGICWRSMRLVDKRGKYYSALDQWGPVLTLPGVRFVNVQYGNCAQELVETCRKLGTEIEEIDGLDLTNDIDGAAALSAALDLVISPSTASAAIAGAVGTEVWFVNPCRMWTQLGTNRVPFYPKTRAFSPPGFADWPEVIARVGGELQTWLSNR
ncbi:MAG TPA: tetratricopeptide repeat protein [Rhizomicrobium sp.]|nr:tetratricopeptide repeat protein [Rhizomicrobium sp.]